MDYKITEKESFKVLASVKKFDYETCKQEIPKFWQHGMYGINIDEKMGGEDFDYMIADLLAPDTVVPENLTVKTIPSFTWAVFSCDGPMPEAFRDVHTKIFSEWLPALKKYEFAAGYCIEAYDDPGKYKNGVCDENYHAEIWIPIKEK